MGVSFTNSLWWLLLPVLAALVWYIRLPWLNLGVNKSIKRREQRRLWIRLILVFLLVLALTGPGLVTTVGRQSVIMVLDKSASVGPAVSQGEKWMRDALAGKPQEAVAGVVAFGRRVVVEEPPGNRPDFYRSTTDPDQDASNIGEALNFARAILPRDTRQRIILLTDGRDTGQSAISCAQLLRNQGVRVDVVPVGLSLESDIRLEALQVAAQARVGENTAIEAVIFADQAGQATLYLERNGEPLQSKEITLKPGGNRLTLSVPVGSAGLHSYRARVQAANGKLDMFAANNEAGAVQEVAGPPKVLVLAAQAQEAVTLVESIKAASGQTAVEVRTPAAAPRGLTEWARYQAVFLVNVPAYSLGEKVLGELETYVRDVGGGLVMVGGADSFGPGGYAGTPVERALPVSMDIKGRGEQPSLGLVLVMDKSGSMSEVAGGAEKMALAREAAARSVDVLTAKDQVGVLAFDFLPWWVVPPGPVDNKDRLRQLIGSIQADGGTEIYPALLSAYQSLRDVPTRIKHIILLTDGQSASGGEYLPLMNDLKKAGITLSTVAVGNDADAGMLQALAEMGRGRFYATADADNIPSIFAKETLTATRDFAVNDRFYPQVANSGTLLRGIGSVPYLEGYITVESKNLAQTVLVSPKGDPILASWQYGLGRAVAWTPDTGGRWSTAWSTGSVFPQLWGNVLSWIMPPGGQGALQISATVAETPSAATSGQTLHVVVEDTGQWQQVRDLTIVATRPDGQTEKTSLTPAGPGRYETRLPVPKPGAYLMAVAENHREQPQMLARSGVVVPYPPEYRETGVDVEALQAIAKAGGGAVLEKPQQAFIDNLPPVQARRDLTTLILALATLLWFADVAGRRLSIRQEEWAALGSAARQQWQKIIPWGDQSTAPGHQAAQTISRLQKLREQGVLAKKTSVPDKQNTETSTSTPTDITKPKAAAPTETAKTNNKTKTTEPIETSETTAHLLAAKRRGFTSHGDGDFGRDDQPRGR